MAGSLLQMQQISKTFPGVQALQNCDFSVEAGEVHALVGENGAGKSTLMKILAGIYDKDAGQIFFNGQEVTIPNPHTAQRMGISMVHQELNLMSHLTAAQNIFIGREERNGIFLNESLQNEKTRRLFQMMNLDLSPTVRVADLSVAKQQMIEIAKTLSFDSKLIIFDEPSAALTTYEIEELFRIIRQLKNSGVGIVYITHRLEELKEISDRVTILRDGIHVDTVDTDKTTNDQVIKMMVGRVIFETRPEVPDKPSEEVILEVRDLSRGREIERVSFQLKKGEILGFAGLVGAGRTETSRAIFGADAYDSGEIIIKGKKVTIKSPNDAVSQSIAYLSEDRKRYGLCLGLDVKTNIAMSIYGKLTSILGWIKTKPETKIARKMVDQLQVRTPSLLQQVKNLSGGNQQKVVIGKWLARDADILIFDEPTRGIDVGAKQEIYALLNDLAAQGKSIIMISSELPEILRMSHRIVVMCEGRVTGILDYSEASQERIMELATRRKEPL